MIDKIGDYWIGKTLRQGLFYCPNTSLFRFIGGLGISIKGAKVLEIGFGANGGADFREVQRRGGDVYGIDINKKYIDSINFVDKKNLACARAGVDPIPFEERFSLIYTRDTIYYLTDGELRQFFEDSYRHCTISGHLIVQFIEADFISDVSLQNVRFKKELFQKIKFESISDPDNPYRFLDADEVRALACDIGFSAVGSIRIIQSHDTQECEFRVDKYFAFQKE